MTVLLPHEMKEELVTVKFSSPVLDSSSRTPPFAKTTLSSTIEAEGREPPKFGRYMKTGPIVVQAKLRTVNTS